LVKEWKWEADGFYSGAHVSISISLPAKSALPILLFFSASNSMTFLSIYRWLLHLLIQLLFLLLLVLFIPRTRRLAHLHPTLFENRMHFVTVADL